MKDQLVILVSTEIFHLSSDGDVPTTIELPHLFEMLGIINIFSIFISHFGGMYTMLILHRLWFYDPRKTLIFQFMFKQESVNCYEYSSKLEFTSKQFNNPSVRGAKIFANIMLSECEST